MRLNEIKKSPINTPQFSAWFGNSKVTNPDGTPKIVYHGTMNGGFSEFKIPESFMSFGSAIGGGIYFTDSERFARSYMKKSDIHPGEGSNKQLYKCYLSIQNPLTISDHSHSITKEIFTKIIKNGDKEWFFTNWIPFSLDYHEPYPKCTPEMIDKYCEITYKQNSFEGDTAILSEMVRAYKTHSLFDNMRKVFRADGIIYTENNASVYVVWDAKQIKSIYNNGNFSKETGNINEAR
jgi:hypothetical protein